MILITQLTFIGQRRGTNGYGAQMGYWAQTGMERKRDIGHKRTCIYANGSLHCDKEPLEYINGY